MSRITSRIMTRTPSRAASRTNCRNPYRSSALAFAAGVAILCAAGHAQSPVPARPIPVTSPPMGWSSWNSFSNTLTSQIVMDQAKAMVTSGLQKAGYEYVNIDEGWWLGKRDAQGNIVINDNVWPPVALNDAPGDMGSIVHFIHNLGLKAGIYTDAGKDGCSMTPDLGFAYRDVGSEGHYEQDFLQFAKGKPRSRRSVRRDRPRHRACRESHGPPSLLLHLQLGQGKPLVLGSAHRRRIRQHLAHQRRHRRSHRRFRNPRRSHGKFRQDARQLRRGHSP
jgi:hypothetical protein